MSDIETDPARDLDRAALVREALRAIPDGAGRDIVASGRVEDVRVRGGLVQVMMRSTRAERDAAQGLARAAEAHLAALPWVERASVVLTAHRDAPNAGDAPPPGAAAPPAAPGPAAGSAPIRRPGPDAHARTPREKLLSEVGRVIAVASGKGGVGKSTVAVNLAVGLARLGLRVGLLDADIHGPSLPRMLGFPDRRAVAAGDRIVPVEAWGVTAISMGLLVEEKRAMIWRGPMVMGALEQLMGQVAWPALDVMVVDMPPGTGDVQLTMAQRTSLAGAVIVSTPQDIALVDARRGIEMFGQVSVPVLGIVENMSVFCCPACGHRTAIFGEGGAREEAARLGVPFLGAVPLLAAIRTAGDAGTPVLASEPASEAGMALSAVATAVRDAIFPAGDRARDSRRG